MRVNEVIPPLAEAGILVLDPTCGTPENDSQPKRLLVKEGLAKRNGRHS